MKTVLALSGGLDSTVLFALRLEGHDVIPITFKYGSKNNQHEMIAAHRIAAYYERMTRVVDLSCVFAEVKSDFLESGRQVLGEDSAFVPGRNLVFASVLAAIAESGGADSISLATYDEPAPYPDCSFEFVSYLQDTVYKGTVGKVAVVYPFIFMTKSDIVRFGRALFVPFELTRTCYSEDEVACGRCPACQERLVAFLDNEIDDPIEYVTRDILPKEF